MHNCSCHVWQLSPPAAGGAVRVRVRLPLVPQVAVHVDQAENSPQVAQCPSREVRASFVKPNDVSALESASTSPHASHSCSPTASANLPTAHCWQALEDPEPALPLNVPFGQSVHVS